MMMRLWVHGVSRACAAVCRAACAGAALLLLAAPAAAARRTAHPVLKPRAESGLHGRVLDTHTGRRHAALRGSSRSRRAMRAPIADEKDQSKPQAKSKGHGKHVAPATKSAGKGRRRRSRPQEVDDVNDPVQMNRVHGKTAARRRGKMIASRAMPQPKQNQMAEAAASPAAKERFATGQARPEDDERLPVTTAANRSHAETVAAVSAPPLSAPTPGKASLPEDHDGKVATIEQAMQPVVLRTRNGRLLMPAPMRGSRDILVHQNTMANSEGLTRIQDDDDLNRMRADHQLVLLPASGVLAVNPELPQNRRYARPWAAQFADDMAHAYYARFRQPLRLNSAVRTVRYQLRLQRVNGNAAAVNGDGASPHLTGQALDFGKRGMSQAQVAWTRAYLAPLMQAGKIDVEEEFHQACFHVSVYRSYAQRSRASVKEVAQARPDAVRPAAPPNGPTDEAPLP